MENNIYVIGVIVIAFFMLWLDNKINGGLDD